MTGELHRRMDGSILLTVIFSEQDLIRVPSIWPGAVFGMAVSDTATQHNPRTYIAECLYAAHVIARQLVESGEP